MIKVIKNYSKLILLLSFFLLLGLIFTGCENGSIVEEIEEEPEIVEFEDSNFEVAVREKIDKPEGNILLEDVKNIEEIIAPGKGIESIEGIQYLENLIVLDFGGYLDESEHEWISNQINDISPLANLINLETLDFWGSEVSDISYLTDLINLETLTFGENKVSDISSLSNLTNLEILFFWSNEVSNIKPISNLTNLERLSFAHNDVSDINHLSSLTNLKTLHFGSNKVSEISSLSNLTNLEILGFSNNEVTDISPLVENDGFGDGDIIYMTDNYLDLTEGSEDMDNINSLISRKVEVEYEPQREKLIE